eukprot:COSAG05_NODE_1887_length_3886_cov_6.005545_5_plen_129_part_00
MHPCKVCVYLVSHMEFACDIYSEKRTSRTLVAMWCDGNAEVQDLLKRVLPLGLLLFLDTPPSTSGAGAEPGAGAAASLGRRERKRGHKASGGKDGRGKRYWKNVTNPMRASCMHVHAQFSWGLDAYII